MITFLRYSNMQKILRLKLSDAISDPAIESEIISITASSYTNHSILLSQELKKNNQIYLSFSLEDKLEAFFMVGWSTINLHGNSIDCVFLGLSATSPEKKGGNLVPALYRHFFHDATQAANLSNRPVAWWFHTASPIVAGVMSRIVGNIGPSLEGILSTEQQNLLTAIQDHFNFTPFKDEHIPCILRNFAQARYAPAEVDRLNARKNKRPSLLESWNINEAAGDRVIFVGYCFPHTSAN
jgi:hypothetical protein